jgi:putative endonuclease
MSYNNPSRRSQGDWWEEQALSYLESLRYQIITTKYHKRLGEIDIVALDLAEHALSFVEVRTRGHVALETFGSPLLSITENKKKRIRTTAKIFMAEYPQWNGYQSRIDVLAGVVSSSRHIEWQLVKNAF